MRILRVPSFAGLTTMSHNLYWKLSTVVLRNLTCSLLGLTWWTVTLKKIGLMIVRVALTEMKSYRLPWFHRNTLKRLVKNGHRTKVLILARPYSINCRPSTLVDRLSVISLLNSLVVRQLSIWQMVLRDRNVTRLRLALHELMIKVGLALLAIRVVRMLLLFVFVRNRRLREMYWYQYGTSLIRNHMNTLGKMDRRLLPNSSFWYDFSTATPAKKLPA